MNGRTDETRTSLQGASSAKTVFSLKAAVVLLSAAYFVYLAGEFVTSFQSPLFIYSDDEWQGVQITAAARVLDGKPLYPDFASEGGYYVYAPLTPLLTALGFKVFGVSVAVVKVLALAAFLFALAGVAWASYGLSASKFAALLAAGIFAATYRFLIAWHINVRPDVFAAAFAVWGVVFAARHYGGRRGPGSTVLAGLFFTLAALSKQNYAILLAAWLAWLFVSAGPRRAVLAALPALVLGGAALVWFDARGEHLVAAMVVMGGHPMKPASIFLEFLAKDFVIIAVPVFLSLAGLAALWRREGPPGARGFWLVIYAAAFLVGLLPYMKFGGRNNAFYLFSAMMSVAAAYGVSTLAARRDRAALPAVLLAPVLFLGIEFAASFSFDASLPIAPHLQPVFRFAQKHKSQRVYFPTRNYITYLASGQYYPDDNFTWDRSLSGLKPPANVVRMVEEQYFDYIIKGFTTGEMNAVLDAHYRPDPSLQLGEYPVYVPSRGTPPHEVPDERP